MILKHTLIFALAFLPASVICAFPVTTSAQQRGGGRASSTDSARIAAVIASFREATRAGDTAAVLALLAPDALIIEAGEIQSKTQYAAHHLSEDIEFAKATTSTRSAAKISIRGDAAWVSSGSVTEGQFGGRAINSAGAELVVLARELGRGRSPARWLIKAVHWSSRRRA